MESDLQTGKAARRRKTGSESQSGKEKLTTAEGAKPNNRKCFEIDIFRDWCKSCGICAAFCPRECIRLDDEGVPTNVDSDRCTGCGWCELHCPDFAISVHEKSDKGRVEDV
ncbi:MAG: 4Fe-4S binding protein [Syntrophobacteraceae bacterium]|jgi:2-oxoglutarate ferredoxin oxidoreductase subunit delta